MYKLFYSFLIPQIMWCKSQEISNEIITFEDAEKSKYFQPNNDCNNNHDCKLQYYSIKRVYSDNHENSPEMFPEIRNFVEILEPLYMNNKGILLIINNYFSLTLPPFDYPRILNTPKMAIQIKYKRTNNENLIWVPKEIKSFALNYTKESNCSISPMFIGLTDKYSDKTYCLVENARFSSNSKPWQHGAVQIQLYPPKRTFEYLNVFEQNSNPMPNDTPFVTVIVDLSKRNIWYTYGFYWLKENMKRNFEILTTDYYELLFNSLRNEVMIAILVEEENKFLNVTVLKLTKSTHTKYYHYEGVSINMVNWKSMTTKDLLNLAIPNSDDLMVWYQFVHLYDRTLHGIERHMSKCINSYTTSRNLAISPYKDQLENLFHAIAYELQTIMQNYTYYVEAKLFDAGKICVNGILQSANPNSRFISDYNVIKWSISRVSFDSNQARGFNLLYINATSMDLRFVTCGEKGKSGFPFRELVSAFHLDLWIFIGVTIITVVLVFTLFSGNMALSKYWLKLSNHTVSVIKVLLEQGDPFPGNSFFKRNHVKIVVSVYMLCCIVISNAYKNNNVYNIIIPRKLVPYNTLEELIQDEFSVYTRTGNIIDYASDTLSQLENATFDPNGHSYRIAALVSEVWRLHIDQIYLEIRWAWDNLVNYTRLHPNVAIIYKTTFKNIVLLQNNSTIDERTGEPLLHKSNVPEFRNQFWESEKQEIWRDLQVCNKSAYVLPAYESNRLARQLRTGGQPTGNTGEEVYMNSFFTINLDGIYFPSIVARCRALGTSGVLKWWNEFHGKMNVKLQDYVPPLKAPTMSGNVLVIFVILLSGIILSFIVFVIEKIRRIFNYALMLAFVLKSTSFKIFRIIWRFKRLSQFVNFVRKYL